MGFSLLIRGFCANYTESSALKNRTISLMIKDANNYFKLQFNHSTKCFDFIKCVGGVVATLSSNAQTFMKFQSYNFLIEQSNVGMRMRLLKNNGSIEKYTNVDTNSFIGSGNLYPLTNDVVGNEADAFLEALNYFPTKNWSDDIIANNLLYEGKSLLNKFESTTQTIAVFPNNRHTLSTGQTTTITELCGSVFIKSTTVSTNTTFVTTSKTNNVKLDINGLFTNLEFKKLD